MNNKKLPPLCHQNCIRCLNKGWSGALWRVQEWQDKVLKEEDKSRTERYFSLDDWDIVDQIVCYDGSLDSYLEIQEMINDGIILGIFVCIDNNDEIPFISRFCRFSGQLKWRCHNSLWIQIPQRFLF
ncbi:MAG: hypothetical protein F6K26_25265 [Moorea sp. SIO2I5]|nr:hypothetical protein [Moorena sp. SIO2I5]